MGQCWACERKPGFGSRLITGEERRALLHEHSAWLYANPDPWLRINGAGVVLDAGPRSVEKPAWPV
jgi:hypothetical protein